VFEDLAAKVALVTGAGSGIGAEVSRRLAAAGAHVVVTDVTEERARPVHEQIAATGGSSRSLGIDVTSEESWRDAAVSLSDTAVQVLVNNAGTGGNEDVEVENLEHWSMVIAVNQTGVFLGMRTFGTLMAAGSGGSIVNIASIFSEVGGFGTAIAYHASKGAVVSMTRSAALRWAREGVRVNAVHPGFVATEMTEQYDQTVIEHLGRTAGDLSVSATPMGRRGTPAEIANVVRFLASDQASFVTGASWLVDGGLTAQ
jgi:NAD(P)-dependent dehydrogenase (short-subunit alcohol dehydrogenase family)